MIGTGYWSTGITVAKVGDQWSVTLEFFDNGFCDQRSTEGTLHCRYLCDDLAKSIDILRFDAESLDICWKDPTVYYKGDGEWDDCPAPEGWEQLVNEQAARLGWRQCYRVSV